MEPVAHLWIQVWSNSATPKLPHVYKLPTEWMHSDIFSVFLPFFMSFSECKIKLLFS